MSSLPSNLSLVGCYGSDGNLCGTGGSCSSCSDPDCTAGDCVSAGSAGATVTPNPAVSPTVAASSASQLTQMTGVMGQWGASIASIVTGTPAVVNASGVKTGIAAVPTSSLLAGSGNGTILLILAAVVVVILVMDKK